MKKPICITLILLLITVIAGTLFYNGILHFNNPSDKEYPVKGIDVSAYQGDIDFEKLHEQNVKFAFIKATEGSNYFDDNFEKNFVNANKTDIKVGAYHFFSFDSEGGKQAELFIKTVPDNCDLPPVVDFEFYGDKEKNPPEKSKVCKQLKIMLDKLEEHYNRKPIIYATESAYNMYLNKDFKDYDLWIRSVYRKPKISGWKFWQYSNRTELDGYSGDEKFIDMNVFGGSENDFEEYCK